VSGTRRRIRAHIDREPGVHFRALTRGLELATGQVQYHLARLDDVTEERVGGRTHYYPPGYDEWERTALAMLRRETARDILVTLCADGRSRPADLATELDIARSTVEHHVDGLVGHDIVRKRRDGRRVTLELTRPDETVRLLSVVEPSRLERLTDRFERLVDGLLEGAD
jgi:predicted transcriptional regulator